MLKHRVITASVLLVLFLLAVFGLPDAGWSVVVLVVIMQGALEWTRMSRYNAKAANLFWWLTLAMMLGLLWLDAVTGRQLHLLFYILSGVFWLAIVPAWLMAGWKIDRPVLMALVGWAVLVPTGLAMMDLRSESPWLLLGMMSLVWAADIAAYFAGRRYGKRKLAPSISPGKTWEGVAGALAGVSIYVTVIWAFSPYTSQFVFLPVLLMASWCWVGLSVIGDLFESAIKRQAGLKDSGALLPGHGGLLDRIDALTSTLPLAALTLLLRQLN